MTVVAAGFAGAVLGAVLTLRVQASRTRRRRYARLARRAHAVQQQERMASRW